MITVSKKEGDISNYLSEENRKLRDTLSKLKREIDLMKEPPLLVCDVLKIVEKRAIVRLPNGSHFFVNISPLLYDKLEPGDRVLAEQKSLVLVDRMDKSKNHSVDFLFGDMLLISSTDTWNSICSVTMISRFSLTRFT